MKQLKIAILLIVTLSILSGCGYTTKERNVIATVTSMEYTPSSTFPMPIYNPALKMPMIMYVPQPEKYEVVISYENVSRTYDNQELYDSVKVDDHLTMTLVEYYDDDGKLQGQDLKFPDEVGQN